MQLKHTPGPWKIEDRVIRASNGQNVAGCVVARMTPGDARLIAAAPDMLEALRYAAELIHVARKYFPKLVSHSDRFTLENTCATISKALSKAGGAR